jgi:hypothetical protein
MIQTQRNRSKRSVHETVDFLIEAFRDDQRADEAQRATATNTWRLAGLDRFEKRRTMPRRGMTLQTSCEVRSCRSRRSAGLNG